MNILGPVLISWEKESDPGALIDYLEHALRIAVIPTLEEDGSRFLVWGKSVEFTDHGVLISRESSGGSFGYYGRVWGGDEEEAAALVAGAEA